MAANSALEPTDRLTESQLDDLLQLYRTTWWGQNRQRAAVQRMLAQTDVVIGLQETATERLVAFCRLLSDGVYRATVYDVIVAEDYRGQGIGRQLMETVIAHPQLQQVEYIDLNCVPDMMPFYSKFDFHPITQVEFMRWVPQANPGVR